LQNFIIKPQKVTNIKIENINAYNFTCEINTKLQIPKSQCKIETYKAHAQTIILFNANNTQQRS